MLTWARLTSSPPYGGQPGLSQIEYNPHKKHLGAFVNLAIFILFAKHTRKVLSRMMRMRIIAMRLKLDS
jgi:hypothetical protein